MKNQPSGLSRLIVIGASAGGIQAVSRLLAQLPANLPAAILVVIHIAPDAPGLLPGILQRVSKLDVSKSLRQGQLLKAGQVYVAPPDLHLLVEDGRLNLSRGPRENRHRPALDPLFRSAAIAHGPRVIGVVLTGNLDDGSSGLLAIKKCGGKTIVQSPDDAEYPDMPRNALEYANPDSVVPLARIGPLLTRIALEKPPRIPRKDCSEKLTTETAIADMRAPLFEMKGLGKPSSIACPECHGVLWVEKEQGHLHFRCRVGHAFSQKTLEASMSESLEQALWTAVRAMEEKISLLHQLAKNASAQKRTLATRHFEARAKELEPAVCILRDVLSKVPLHRQ